MIEAIRKLVMEAAILLFLLTVSPVYAMSEVESRNGNRRAVQVQMISIRQRHRALDRRMNLYIQRDFYQSPNVLYRNYGNRETFLLAQ